MQIYPFVFDTSAVRDIGDFEEPKWSAFRARWLKDKLSTSWIPIVVSEVLGTNLIGAKESGDPKALAVIVRSVKRFDFLAKTRVLPHMKDLVRAAFYRFAGRSAPPEIFGSYTAQFQELVKLGKKVEDFREVSVKKISDTKLKVGLQVPHTREVLGVNIDLIFGPHVDEEVLKWKARLNGATFKDDKQVDRILAEHMPGMLKGLGTQNGVPPDVLAKLDDPALISDPKQLDQMFGTCFAYTAIVQQRYYVERALGKLIGDVEENTGRDLMVATYLSCGARLVVQDKRARNYLKRFTAESSVISTTALLEEFGINW
jgi:hypothetical protein